MKKQGSYSGVGAALVLLSLTALALVVFASLSFFRARGNLQLTEKAVAANEAYYAAERAAQTALAEADALWQQGSSPADCRTADILDEGDGSFSFFQTIDENRRIAVRFSCGGRFALERYQIESSPAAADEEDAG